MNGFKIDKGVPVPSMKGRRHKYGFDRLEIGDSIFVAMSEADTNTVRGAAYRFARENGVRMTCRHMDGGVRVWRVE